VLIIDISVSGKTWKLLV